MTNETLAEKTIRLSKELGQVREQISKCTEKDHKWGKMVPVYSEHYHNKHHNILDLYLFAYNYIEHNGERIQISGETTMYREYRFRLTCKNCGTIDYDDHTFDRHEEHVKRIAANNLGEKEICEYCKL